MERTEFSKDDSLIIKGLAILAIMLHNLFRWIDPTTGENEFGFAAHTVHKFIEQLTSQPLEFFNIIFSYLGHFGVQAFILISGYGLTKSMLDKPKCWTAFMWARLKKIYPLLVIAIGTFYAFSMAFGYNLPEHYTQETTFKLLLIHTLQPDSGLSMCGPWWFFGLIVQLYVLFPIILGLTQRFGTKILIGTAVISYLWILTALFFYDHDAGNMLTMQNAPGHLPEYCFGIWLALAPRKISNYWTLPALAVFVLGNFYQLFYPFTFLAASIIIVICHNNINKPLANHKALKMPLVFLGSISMFLFAIHGFMRQPFIDFAESHSNAGISLLTALGYITFVVAISMIIKPIYNTILWLLDKIHFPSIILKADKIFMAAPLLLFAAVSIYHGTSLIQKHLTFNSNNQTAEYSFTASNIIEPDTLYSNILHINIEQCGLIKVAIDAEIDTQESDNSHNPLLVTEIEDIFWDKFILPKTDGFEKIHFEQTIYNSFLDWYKNKNIKIYFWNNKSSSMKFRNAEVKISYQR